MGLCVTYRYCYIYIDFNAERSLYDIPMMHGPHELREFKLAFFGSEVDQLLL